MAHIITTLVDGPGTCASTWGSVGGGIARVPNIGGIWWYGRATGGGSD